MVDRERWSGNTPVWFAGGMALGVAQYASAPREIGWFAVVMLLALSIAVVCLVRERIRASIPAIALLAFASGMVAAKWEASRVGSHMMVGEATTRITGVVERRTVDARGRTRYTVRLARTEDPTLQFAPDRARLFVSAKHDPIAIGGGIEALVRLRQPSGPALPGGYDFAYYNYFDRLGAQGFVLGRPSMTEEARRGSAFAVERLRASIASIVREALPETAGGVAAALLTGDRRGIPDDVTETLRTSGLAHVLAISGMHMALVSGFVIAVLRLGLATGGAAERWPTRKIAASVALVFAGSYLALSGFGVSAQRAFVMLAVMLIAVLFDRPALTMRNVGLAALVVIALRPHEVTGPGFQMSFGATAALIAVYGAWKRLRPHVERPDRVWWPDWVRGPFGFALGLAVTSMIAGTATAIFAAYHFQRIAPYGLLGNLAAMPVVTFITMPSGVLTALAMPFGLEAIPLAVMGWSIDLVLRIAAWVADMRPPLETGAISTGPFLLAVMGLFAIVALRTRFALIAVLPLACAALALEEPRVAMLVAERGEMVGVVREGAIHVDRVRPNAFLAKQWEAAYRLKTVGSEGGGFNCEEREGPCTIAVRGLTIRTIRERDDLGPACDEADIVVTAFRTRLDRCRSGAFVLNAILTNRRGSASVDLLALAKASVGQERKGFRSRLATLSTEAILRHVEFALPNAPRPWTAHRYAVLKSTKRSE